VRYGNWKLLVYRSGTMKLCDISKDIKEENDLAKVHPENMKELRGTLIEWEMGVEKYSGVQ
jgi:hypothetical protein